MENQEIFDMIRYFYFYFLYFVFLNNTGVGSIGTFLEGPIIGWIVAQYGWSAMFTCMIALSVLGAFTAFRAARYQRLSKPTPSSSIEQLIP